MPESPRKADRDIALADGVENTFKVPKRVAVYRL